MAHGSTVAAGVGVSAEPRTSAMDGVGGHEDQRAWGVKEREMLAVSTWSQCARMIMSE